jgi:hypothetical protein
MTNRRNPHGRTISLATARLWCIGQESKSELSPPCFVFCIVIAPADHRFLRGTFRYLCIRYRRRAYSVISESRVSVEKRRKGFTLETRGFARRANKIANDRTRHEETDLSESKNQKHKEHFASITQTSRHCNLCSRHLCRKSTNQSNITRPPAN